MFEDAPSRFATELELLVAMYPEQVSYNPQSRDLKFTANGGALLQLRIPDTYPESGFPDILEAKDEAKNDARERVRCAVRDMGLGEGEEALDAIIAGFQSVLSTQDATTDLPREEDTAASDGSTGHTPTKTVIIWLHHLLALSKRKLALSANAVSGITKPGYPGVLLFSGPAAAVAEHVDALKAENWQAFQVRYEDAGVWEFEHGSGIREVESMAEVVKGLQDERNREQFLRAVGIK